MREDKQGGPAFPFEYHNQTSSAQRGFFETGHVAPGASLQFTGMTLRDYFAAKAMQGMLAYPGDASQGSHHNNNTVEGVAYMAYLYADAMLAERDK